MKRSHALYHRAKEVIPGGTQLLSKRPEMFLPDQWPAYYLRAQGAEIVDIDGRTWIDVSIGAVGTCPLGYADPQVDRCVIDAVRSGTTSTLNCPEEVALAEKLLSIHPWAQQVRYARSGGEAMAVAVRIARASTRRDTIAFSGYHGWHDWYLAANLARADALDDQLLPGLDPGGVPTGLRGTALPFRHGDREAFDRLIADHGASLAAIVIEPMRKIAPPPGFLEHLRQEANRVGAVLIVDEITAGFRMNIGGLHLEFDLVPDIAVFAKAIGNGYPIAAIIGRREIMCAAEGSFISSTHWSERIGPTAALATVTKMERENVPERLIAAGRRMRSGWRRLADRHGLKITICGMPPLSTFSFDDQDRAQVLITLYSQEMLDRGFLASGAFYASLAHDEEVIDRALEATDGAFARICRAIDDGDLLGALRGPVAHTGFARLS